MSETITGFIQAKERAKSGKSWRVQLNGRWLTVSNRANLDGVEQGIYVEARMGGFNGNDGKWVPTIDAIRPAQAPQQPPNGYQGTASPQPGNAPVSRLASAHWDDSALRFISNVVGCAITAGKCADPERILAWTAEAEAALKSLGQAQAPAWGSQQTPGSAPREPGSDDEPHPFDDSDVPW